MCTLNKLGSDQHMFPVKLPQSPPGPGHKPDELDIYTYCHNLSNIGIAGKC